MFEAHVLHLLRRYLGEYVHGLSAEALRISVWKGDVVLKDLKLKAEALNSLKLPVTVKAGFVGTITLKVPWKSFGKEPVIVLIDRVFILAHPASDGRTFEEEDRESLFEVKMQQIEEAEAATLEAVSRSKMGNPGGSSWLSSLIATIIGNLKISISNVHIRYEDSVSNKGHPFASGMTLAKLAAVTTDESGNETFDTSGALDKLRKSLQLERLALYHDSDSMPWKIDKKWEDLSSQEWIEIFEDGINGPTTDHGEICKWAMNRTYVVSPINGALKYHRLGNQERNDPEVPFEEASLVLTDVSLTIFEAQYHDWIKLFEAVSRYKTYIEIVHLRPVVPVSQGSHLWWRYAARASLQQKQLCYRFSWDQIKQLCQLRRRYVQLYASFLQHSGNVKNSEVWEIEKDLDSKVILLWRLLAHAKVESVKSKEAAEQRRNRNKSWFSFGWKSSSGNISESPELSEGGLTKEEWQAINNFLSYQPDEDVTLHSGKDMQNMIKFLVNISIGQAAARIISVQETELLCGRFEELHISTKFRLRSIHCDILLKFYGLSSPEGSLAQSACSEQKENALAASFVQWPVGEDVDWKLSATISPCHATVWMESYERFLEFVKRSNAISPRVAMETATALQMKFEKVSRRAQEQFQMVLEEQSRFALDIDFGAPKVRVPIRACASTQCDGHFLLDFGQFTLYTKDCHAGDHSQNLYSRFYVSGRDIAAFFIDSASDCQSGTFLMPTYNSVASSLHDASGNCYSIIDRCGMVVIVDQIKGPHPSYPSTRVFVQVPNLGIHFSPARYQRIMELLNILYGTVESSSEPFSGSVDAPWRSADLSAKARILVWKGIGKSVASWQPCYVVLSGLYLYVMETEKSISYQRFLSMAGKQVLEVPPSNVGGSNFCIAVSFRGMRVQKALESSSTWVIELRDEEEKNYWMKGLVQATYQASSPPTVDVLEDLGSMLETDESSVIGPKTADLVVNGALVETNVFIYAKTIETQGETPGKLEETLILEILAGGGKIHVTCWESDLTVKMKLHSLKIKDELQGRMSKCQYLACSVLKNDSIFTLPNTSRLLSREFNVSSMDEDDIFDDALPEFMCFSESVGCSQNLDVTHAVKTANNHQSVEMEALEALLPENDFGKGKDASEEIFYESEGSDNSDFVSVSFSTRSLSSPDYNGVDTQMDIRMSKLEFFCNRPTLVALIALGIDLSSVNSWLSNMEGKSANDDLLPSTEKREDNGHAIVKGLLGHGKGRVIFNLNMNVASVSVFLNKEDGSQLAMFIQESFLLDLKVHPSSLSIEGTLGNFRLCDMSLGVDHHWGWLCDIRKPGVESLIKFTFKSYSEDDDDYEGYDYSLFCRLSAVRIVFLYRFVQEVTVYFMELATPHTEEAIKLVDKVGDFEWLIQKYEIDGSTSVKLDLSLDTPIIIVPRNSVSKDFIQLDLGQLRVTNEFSWHGSPENDPSAVHIDILHAEILGINMSVGFETFIGKPMIRECHGFDVYVRRSLRDVFRKVPTFALEVKVDLLHAVMSDKEYNVILDCTYMNLNEQPRLPCSFRDDISGSKETIRLLADKVNMNSQMLLSRNVTIMAVEVKYALLELCNGIDEESPLAHIALDGLWVSYRITSLSETDLYITIPKFSIVDIRPDTKPEMRLMLGSATDASKQVSGSFPFSLNRSGQIRMTSEGSPGIEPPNSTMFLMDYRWRVSSQSFVVRIQQPRILVVPDFLLAVGEFFVPALGAMTGREEIMDPKNDPITRNSSIILSQPIYKQTEEVVHLSPSKQLVIDTVGVDDYTYDGCGKIICLSEGALEKEDRLLRSQPIIIIGHGKRLRFVNVKIENGYLLRKYTYLSNDSSYSVSSDDGVDISMLDHFTSDSEKKSQTYIDYSSETCNTSQVTSDKMESLTFEAQVVYPEFTFYDGTKSSLDDSIFGEKLLRAKMDLSFMYASKERDTWIRALVKDLMVESGSGLIVLEPVDLSGGYTSVKDKTSISIMSTDMRIHLSLSVISLVLSLHSQAAAALQFTNANPLALCTNFEQLWVSPRENGAHNNLTFWRPRAPSNYVILGDCVTSRPVPPSQSVIAVSNTYGRVRKPLGFKIIGSFSGIQGLACGEGSTTDDCDCSLWMPVAPPGYKAMGCVAAVGDQPPPNHIVYCLREDLVASAPYSECILSVSASAYFSSGFSIWRLDNVLRSFSAHPSSECPPKNISYDISHILLWNSNRHHSSAKEYTDSSVDDGFHSNQKIDEKTTSSGRDMLRSISRASNYFTTTPNFERIWWDKGSDIRRAVSIWRPIARPDYAIVGDCITEGLEPPALGIIFKAKNADVSARPVQFTKVAHIMGKGAEDVWFWYPIPPPGYVSVGCIVTRMDEMPLADSICCPRMDLVNQGTIIEVPITRSSRSRASHCWSIWKVENQAHTFLARSDLKKPSSRLAYTIGDYVKPKKKENAQENLTADMKLRCFSLTILDSLRGMMTPIFDTTITNIKIATHGRPKAMDAVLVSSIAASTFNTQLEAWEPLVEPFDGIFKFETYDTGKPQSRLGMRVHVAATNTLNMNASAANLETFAETIISWRRQIELEEKAARLNEELGTHSELGRKSAFSALDEDDFQTVIIENKLGIDIYLKKLEQSADTVEVLHHNTSVSIWIPPPTFSDRLNVADQSGEARHYVSVQILEAKDLPIVDDGNSHNFFCALRLVVENQTTDQQKLFPQSSRTKCVKPIISNTADAAKGSAKWNELFIFEVPRKGTAKLEIEVTNLAAKAGKGEVVGAFSFVVGHGANTLKKVASGRILQQSNNMKNVISYPLQRRVQSNNDEHSHESACLLVSTTYFEKKRNPNLQRDSRSEQNVDRDIGFWVGLKPEDKWESFRLLLPLSVVPKVLNNEFMAMEVFMENGKKHAIFRGLATVVNYTDVNLDLSIYHESVIENQNSIHARQQLSEDDKRFSEGFLSSLAPESSANLPWRSTFRDSDQCFQVRPAVDLSQPSYLWGRTVAVSSADSFGKDQFFIDQSLLYNDPSKRGNKVSNLFKLNQLEKKDVLLCCRPGTGSKLFWLSIGADASALHTEINAPVYDWKICINSPLKLENRLPCPAEFTIWEKTKDGTTIEREQGILSSRKSVNIYSADIQKALYLSLFVQGGWVLEREPVPLLDLSSNNHVSSFWMVHQQSHRRLRISIERDMGGTTAAPKTIRFFVPYWIVNDCSLPLTYQLVELESADNADTDLFLSRAVKSAKTTFSAVSMEKRRFGSRKNIQMLEIIDDTTPIPSMLSPRDYASRSGGTLFPSRGDSFVSPRVGIAVAVRNSHNFSPGISLLELEKKERIDVKAFKPDGSYYKLSALLNMTSDRTKVICFQPQILFVNRVGCSVCLRQCDSQMIEWIHPADPPKPFAWDSSAKFELLKLRVDGYEWSSSFSVSTEGLMCISLKRVTGNEQLNLKVAVRGGTKNSRYDVVICPYSFSSPYRIENRSMFLPLHFRQVDGITDSWRPLLPNSSSSFIWEDLGRRRLLEVLIGGVDPAKSETFNIDEICDHQAIHVDGKALRVTVLKEDKTNIVRISDWMPENEFGAVKSGGPPTAMSPHFINNLQHQNSLSTSTGEFHFIIELPELGLSIIDHTPEEILYLSIQNLLLSYSSGLGSEISRFKIRMCGVQLDNQLPLSPMPVLFRLQKAGEETDYVLKFSMTMQSNGSPDFCVYPYIGLHGPENSAFVINIHEPIIWRLHEMIQQVNLKRLQDTQETAVSVDPIIQIGVLNISEVRLKVSMAMSPTQRPRGVLGFWASLMTALGNTENMPVKINPRFHENVSMRQSTMVSNAISNVQKDLLSQPLQLLSGVDILGNASSALGHMSKGVAALSMDKKFIQNRQRQEKKGVEDLGDVIREGGGALAKGLFRGVTGILTKPLEGAKSSGVEGFVQGVGKGIIGAAAQPVSGVLDLLSKTTEGANAVRMKIASAITSEEQLLRKRLPRVIGGDNLLRPFDDYKSEGQVILQLAESGSFLGQVDLFKVRGKFALSDAYEDHFLLPKGKILMVTHRRVILLQQPSNIINQRKFSPARDPCSVVWDVMWDTLMFMELAYGKKDHPKAPHSRLILYLQTRSTESKDQIRIIKCIRESQQAVDIYTSIERALNTYGPNKSMGMLKRKVTKPYSPIGDTTTYESTSKECGGSLWSPQQVPSSVRLSSTFGSSTN